MGIVSRVFKRIVYGKHHRLEIELAKCESPMEQRFLMAAYPVLSQYSRMVPQHQIAGYRADFALPDVLIVIEIDGHDYHSTKAQLAADMQRQRDLTRHGWTVIRFTGSEVYWHADGCAREVEGIIHARSGGGVRWPTNRSVNAKQKSIT